MLTKLIEWLATALSSAVDSALPDALRTPEGDPYRRARLTVIIAMVLIAACLVSALVRLSAGAYTLVVPVTAVILCLSVGLHRLKRTGTTLWLGHTISGSVVLSIAALNVGSGATVPGPVYTTLLVPLISILVLGPRLGSIWGALGIVQLVVGFWLGVIEWDPPIDPSPELVLLGSYVAPVLCATIVFCLTLSYESLTKKALADFERARDLAQAADRAKTQFLANTSHELRTPMNGVLGMAQLLEHGELASEQRALVRRLRHSGSLLLVLLGDLIDLAKADFSGIELREEYVDLARAVDEVYDLLELEADRKGICFEVAAPRGLEVWLDGGRLRQVLVNLVGNALKFTREGSVRLTAQVELLEPDSLTSPSRIGDAPALDASDSKQRGSKKPRVADQSLYAVTFRVRDTGVGISDEALGRIFDRFSQADSTTSRVFGGAGLGLAISREIVERMGGTLTVKSRLGEGSCFECRLVCPGRTVRVQPMGAASSSLPPNLGLSVLVAEDNATNMMVTRGFLEILGCRSLPAASGREAIEVFATSQADLVLLDCQMPELDGYQVARSIRLLEREVGRVAGATPIIAVTANLAPDERARCLEAGMNDYLAKPFTLDELAECLESWAPEMPALASDPAQLSQVRSLPAPLLRLRELSEAGEDFAQRVVEGWKLECERALVELHAAVAAADCREVARIAHARKGASRNVGAVGSAEHFAKLEVLAKAGAADELSACLETCEAVLLADIDEIQLLLRQS